MNGSSQGGGHIYPMCKIGKDIPKGDEMINYKGKNPNSGSCRISMKRSGSKCPCSAHTIPKLFYMRNGRLSSIIAQRYANLPAFLHNFSQTFAGAGSTVFRGYENFVKKCSVRRKIFTKTEPFHRLFFPHFRKTERAAQNSPPSFHSHVTIL